VAHVSGIGDARLARLAVPPGMPVLWGTKAVDARAVGCAHFQGSKRTSRSFQLVALDVRRLASPPEPIVSASSAKSSDAIGPRR